MLTKYNIESILFLDIETVPAFPGFSEVSSPFRELWIHKAEQLSQKGEQTSADPEQKAATLYERAGIYAEFGKIICISTGVFRNQSLWIKSFAGDDEKELLASFNEMLEKAKEKGFSYLCAHNGKEFDYPYIIRRMLIHGLDVPEILDLSMKKPWEIPHLDTMELWKFGDYKSYTSLELMAACLGIPTPKDDIRGSDVARVYWTEKDLARIVTYCQKDVITIVNIFLRLKGLQPIPDSMVTLVS
jgi:uncharacterized protein YprB with RNaseH-like and TPR domain